MTVGGCDVEQYSARGIAVLVTSWPQPPPRWDTQDAASWQLCRVQVAAGPRALLLWGWMWLLPRTGLSMNRAQQLSSIWIFIPEPGHTNSQGCGEKQTLWSHHRQIQTCSTAPAQRRVGIPHQTALLDPPHPCLLTGEGWQIPPPDLAVA